MPVLQPAHFKFLECVFGQEYSPCVTPLMVLVEMPPIDLLSRITWCPWFGGFISGLANGMTDIKATNYPISTYTKIFYILSYIYMYVWLYVGVFVYRAFLTANISRCLCLIHTAVSLQSNRAFGKSRAQTCSSFLNEYERPFQPNKYICSFILLCSEKWFAYMLVI